MIFLTTVDFPDPVPPAIPITSMTFLFLLMGASRATANPQSLPYCPQN